MVIGSSFWVIVIGIGVPSFAERTDDGPTQLKNPHEQQRANATTLCVFFLLHHQELSGTVTKVAAKHLNRLMAMESKASDDFSSITIGRIGMMMCYSCWIHAELVSTISTEKCRPNISY